MVEVNESGINASPPASTPPRRRRRSWRWWVVVAVLGGLIGAYVWLTSAGHLKGVAQRGIEQALGGRATVADARFSWVGPIVLEGITLELEDAGVLNGQVLSVERVTIEHNPWSLLRGVLRPVRVILEKPVIHMTEDAATGRFNWQVLLQRKQEREDLGKVKLPKYLPHMECMGGRLRFARATEKGVQELGSLGIEGALAPAKRSAEVYEWILAEEGDRPDALMIRGRFNLLTSMVHASLEHFRFDRVPVDMLPLGARQWWDRIQPQGDVPQLEVGFDARTGPWARFKLRNWRLTLPVGEETSRLEARAGDITFRRDSLRIEHLEGRLHDCEFQLTGDMRDLGADMTMRLKLLMAGPIPRTPEQQSILPPVTRRYIQRFAAQGQFETEIVIERTREDPQVASMGWLRLMDVSLSDQQNPYPILHTTGRILFDREAVRIQDIRGYGPTGAVIEAQGLITPPNNDGAVDVRVTMKKVPVDQYLLGSLAAEEREVVAQLVSPAALQVIRERQAVAQAGDGSAAGNKSISPLEAFQLDGTLDIAVVTHCPPGKDQAWTITTTLDLAGVDMLCEFWPYPMTVQSGQVVVRGREVRVEDVHLRGLTGAEAQFQGTVLPDPMKPGKALTDLQVRAHRVPMDEVLLASLPPEDAAILRRIRLTGQFEAEAKIFTDPATHQLAYQIQSHLTGATARPFGELPFEDMTGTLTLEPGLLKLQSIVGRQGQGSVEVSGQMQWNESRQRHFNLTGSLRNFRLEEGWTRGLAWSEDEESAGLGRRLQAYHPTGLLDAEMSVRTAPGAAMMYDLKLHPKQMGLTLDGVRLEMENMTGALRVQPGRLTLENASAQVASCRLEASGWLDTAEASSAGPWAWVNALDLTFSAQGDRYEPKLRALLPGTLGQALAEMEFQGGFALQQARLQIQRAAGEAQVEFAGKVDLKRAQAVLGVPITDFDGALEIRLRPRAGMQSKFELNAQAMSTRILGRLVEPLSFRLESADNNPSQTVDLWELHDLKGDCYGGRVLGSGSVIPGRQGGYSIRLLLDNAALDPIIHPQRAAAPAGKEAPTGRISANLALEDSAADLSKRRGRGELLIRDARLYEVPVAMTMLQIINLSLPASQAFDRASARYVISGDTINLESLRFDAPNLRIAGGGVVRFPSLELDLDMFTRNPGGSALGPLGEAIDIIKDGLVSIRVQGTLDNPKAQLQSFEGVRRTWRDIFGATGQE